MAIHLAVADPMGAASMAVVSMGVEASTVAEAMVEVTVASEPYE
jgi:hypothetical protein